MKVARVTWLPPLRFDSFMPLFDAVLGPRAKADPVSLQRPSYQPASTNKREAQRGSGKEPTNVCEPGALLPPGQPVPKDIDCEEDESGDGGAQQPYAHKE